MSNVFLNSKLTSSLKKQLNNFDQLIKNGLILEPNLNPLWKWRDLEVWRSYDWGSIHNTWSPIKTNKQVETSIIDIEKFLKQCLNGENE